MSSWYALLKAHVAVSRRARRITVGPPRREGPAIRKMSAVSADKLMEVTRGVKCASGVTPSRLSKSNSPFPSAVDTATVSTMERVRSSNRNTAALSATTTQLSVRLPSTVQLPTWNTPRAVHASRRAGQSRGRNTVRLETRSAIAGLSCGAQDEAHVVSQANTAREKSSYRYSRGDAGSSATAETSAYALPSSASTTNTSLREKSMTLTFTTHRSASTSTTMPPATCTSPRGTDTRIPGSGCLEPTAPGGRPPPPASRPRVPFGYARHTVPDASAKMRCSSGAHGVSGARIGCSPQAASSSASDSTGSVEVLKRQKLAAVDTQAPRTLTPRVWFA
eukprot:2365960-Rhodomonas_salina.1